MASEPMTTWCAFCGVDTRLPLTWAVIARGTAAMEVRSVRTTCTEYNGQIACIRYLPKREAP